MSPQVRLVYLILVQNLANFAFFAVQATARVDVQLLTVADQEQIVEVIKVILQELVPERVVEQIVDVPQILEQDAEVIKVFLQEQCQRMRFFF